MLIKLPRHRGGKKWSKILRMGKQKKTRSLFRPQVHFPFKLLTILSPNIFSSTGPTLQDIRLELAEEEKNKAIAAREADDVSAVETEAISASQYIFLMLEVEDQQCVFFLYSGIDSDTFSRSQLKLDVAKAHSPTKRVLANFEQRRTRIEQQINRVRGLQRTHCPAAIQILSTAAPSVDKAGKPIPPPLSENITLMFPSEITPAFQDKRLAEIESRFRDGQCSSSLHDLRHGLLVKRRIYTFKTIHVRKQKKSTRSRTLLKNQQNRIDSAAATYRRAHAAKGALVGSYIRGDPKATKATDEMVGWHTLQDADIRMMVDAEEEERRKQRPMKSRQKEAKKLNADGNIQGIPGAGEGRRVISWIWLAADVGNGFSTSQALYDGT